MMKLRLFFGAFWVGLGVLFSDSIAHACSVCIFAAPGDPLLEAINWSILFLIAMPYTILFSIVGFLFYTYRRSSQKKVRGRTERAPILGLAWVYKESGR